MTDAYKYQPKHAMVVCWHLGVGSSMFYPFPLFSSDPDFYHSVPSKDIKTDPNSNENTYGMRPGTHTHTHTELQVLACWVLSLYGMSHSLGYGPICSYLQMVL